MKPGQVQAAHPDRDRPGHQSRTPSTGTPAAGFGNWIEDLAGDGLFELKRLKKKIDQAPVPSPGPGVDGGNPDRE
jgi:hypothetical protein